MTPNHHSAAARQDSGRLGDHDFPKALGAIFATPERPGLARPHLSSLSRRERNCLHLVAAGKSNAEIAVQLGLSIPTIATHVNNARAKLQAKTRAQAVAHYILASLL